MTDKEIFFLVWCLAISGFTIYYSYKCICSVREKIKVTENIP